MPLANRLAQTRDSFWFLPSLMAAVSTGAAVVTTRVDAHISRGALRDLGWAWVGSAEGARSVLSVIAGSTMTVAGVVFSITVTALAQASAHFGPRVLRNFTADRGNQIVLGTFIATFVYCLMVLRTVRAEGESATPSVPYLSVNVGLVLAVASLGVLIYFIHHITRSLQVEVLLSGIGRELDASVRSLFPRDLGEPAQEGAEADFGAYGAVATSIRASEAGYLQSIDQRRLMQLAVAHDLVVRVCARPGDFVSQDTELMHVLGPGRAEKDLSQALQNCTAVGAFRTPYEDPGYSVQQLLEVAARALSPGVNEIFTALSSIDWLVTGLQRTAGREVPSAVRLDAQGQARVFANPLTFVDLADMTFETLRPYAGQQRSVALRLLQALERLAGAVRRIEDQQALARHLEALLVEGEALTHPADGASIGRAAQRTRRAIDEAQVRLLVPRECR